MADEYPSFGAGKGEGSRSFSCGNWVPTVTWPPPYGVCEVTCLSQLEEGRRPVVEAVPPSRSSLMGILLLLVKLSVLVNGGRG